MRFELWKAQGNGSLTFFPVDQAKCQHLEPDAALIGTVEAASWEEAMTMYRQYMGWGPYIPMSEN
jgi:hypothetical protein